MEPNKHQLFVAPPCNFCNALATRWKLLAPGLWLSVCINPRCKMYCAQTCSEDKAKK